MPYSRLDGDLFLMVTRGEGRSEFEEFGIGGAPPPSTQTTPAKPKESEKKKPEEAPAAPPTLSVPELDKNGATKTIEDLRSFRNQAVSPFDAVIESRGGMLDGRIQGYRTFQLRNEGENWQRLLVTLEGLFSDLNRRAIWIRGNYDAWIVSGDEIDGAIEKAAFALSRHLAKSGFGLAFDIPPEVLADEIERRERVDLENLYPRLRGGASVQDGFMELGERRREFFEDDKGLQLLLAEIEKVLAELKKEDLPKGKKLQEWMAQIQQIEGNLTKGKKFAKELQEAVTKGAERIKALQAKNGEFREALISPAFQDERFNFAPLAKGEVIRFKVSRDAELKDGQLVPGKSNEIELRTAPVYSARFGTGVLFSDLDDPTFKFDRDNFLRFNEEGNGEVRLGLFVHNVWGRRSPLLKSTPFEKFVPTFSLGIPVVNSKAIFEEVLLGLNWELTSGIDLVVGAHFAKVNALRDDALLDVQVEVSEGVTLDVADFQKTTTDSALFFGIVVNSEIFKLFQNGGNGGS